MEVISLGLFKRQSSVRYLQDTQSKVKSVVKKYICSGIKRSEINGSCDKYNEKKITN